jgi:cytidine deaminase
MELKKIETLTVEKQKLIEMAKEARKDSYSPYSGFSIGAALLTKEGPVFTGTNIENASYGLTNCAERTAIFKAVSEGYREFKVLAVVADTQRPVPPCGACRQVINEFGGDIKVLMANMKGDVLELTGAQLLPDAFDRGDFA